MKNLASGENNFGDFHENYIYEIDIYAEIDRVLPQSTNVTNHDEIRTACTLYYVLVSRPITIKPRSHRVRRCASTRPIKLMLKIESIHTDRVDARRARQLICIHRMNE